MKLSENQVEVSTDSHLTGGGVRALESTDIALHKQHEIAVNDAGIRLFPAHENARDWFIWLIESATKSRITPENSRQDIRNMIHTVEQGFAACVNRGDADDLSESYHLKHTFAPGAYVREISIPAMNLVVGKIHKHEHVNFISKGRVVVLTEQGGIEELVAPVTMISPAGTKRLLFTLEDTVWTVVHVTEETDLDKIEAQVIAKTYTEIGMEEPVLCIESRG